MAQSTCTHTELSEQLSTRAVEGISFKFCNSSRRSRTKIIQINSTSSVSSCLLSNPRDILVFGTHCSRASSAKAMQYLTRINWQTIMAVKVLTGSHVEPKRQEIKRDADDPMAAGLVFEAIMTLEETSSSSPRRQTPLKRSCVPADSVQRERSQLLPLSDQH